jgi:hypothetical protein
MFNKDLIDLILKGKKTMTSRTKKLYESGTITNLMANKDYSKLTGKFIKITKVYPKKLGDFTNEDAQREGFNNLQDFKDYWNQRLNSKNSWNNNRVVWIHEFSLV